MPARAPLTLDPAAASDDKVVPDEREQVAAWLDAVRKQPRKWRRILEAHTPGFDAETMRLDLEQMLTAFGDFDPRLVFHRFLRRPDAAADARPFPLRMEITNFVLCTAVAIFVIALLLLSQ